MPTSTLEEAVFWVVFTSLAGTTIYLMSILVLNLPTQPFQIAGFVTILMAVALLAYALYDARRIKE